MAQSDPAPRVSLRIAHDPCLSLALWQSYVPLIQRITVENATTAPLDSLTLALSTEPAVAAPKEIALERLPPGASRQLERIDLELSPGALAAQRERGRGRLRVEVRQGVEVLAAAAPELAILPWDEWPGTRVLPEVLAAFVLPEHPEVARLLRAAEEQLQRDTGDGTLDGYRRDPGRVRAILAALWSVLGAAGIGAAALPAGFEQHGQAIRTPERVLGERLGTCLDLALLLAACLERAGLHPLLVLQEGHVLAGVWLHAERFGAPVVHEVPLLQRRIERGLVEVIDTGLLTQAPLPALDVACNEARAKLGLVERFVLAVDVACARAQHVRPLPDRGAEAARPEPAVAAAPEPAPEPRSRLEVWKHQLLDLTLRNRLLAFRPGKSAIPLRAPDLAALEDALAQDKLLELVADPEPDPPPARGAGDEAERRRTRDRLAAGKVCAALDGEELDRRLVKLYRDARTSLEEGGASILYLALGFLRWREAAGPAPARLAPILLLPLELVRPSVKVGFRMRLSADEPPRFNVTLLKKLELDFGVVTQGLDELLEDEAGLDVRAILGAFGAAVAAKTSFEVVPDAAIGLYSFTKFLMWRDLEERTAQLLRNAVVRHLLERPEQAFGGERQPFPEPAELDRTLDLEKTLCPLDADSSQLAAVVAAAQGRSFVLQGPPGTGKSQTIANLIAQCLAEGRRVLFVSEKMAALNVVHRRLSAVGLAPFCLELHSNKASKKDVLDQLGQALAVGEQRDPEQWAQVARDLEQARAELNRYCELLHQRRALGISVFAGIARATELRGAVEVALEASAVAGADAARLAALRALVERLAATGAAVAPLREHPWRAARCREWDPGLEQQALASAGRAHAIAAELGPAATRLQGELGLAALPCTRPLLALLARVAECLAEGPLPAAALLHDPSWPDARDRLRALLARGKRRDALRAALLPRYDARLVELDLAGLRAQLQRASESFVLFRGMRRRPVLAALQPLARDTLGDPDALARDLEQALQWKSEQQALTASSEEARRFFAAAWRDGEADWAELEGCSTRADALRTALAAFARAGVDPARCAALAVAGPAREAAGEALPHAARALAELHRRWLGAWDELDRLLELDEGCLWTDDTQSWPERVVASLQAMLAASGRLRPFTAWTRARKEAIEQALTPLTEALDRGKVEPSGASAAFERAFFTAWVAAMLEAEPELRRFSGAEHAQRIARFRELDRQWLALTRDMLHARLAARLPKVGGVEAGADSEVGVLQRQMKKARAHWPLRRLFGAIPNLLPRLKPCMLMSPLSVAQYLDPATPPFDLVVFDEASQIPVPDAVGAIGRGRELVVVGDSRQMPPTTFFSRVDDPEDAVADEEVEELESILDECVAARLPSRQLDWHYRSRHESLIAFSNWHYYGGRLLTFPSASDRRGELGVRWQHVPGVYDRARTRQNRAEAEAVVGEIATRVKSGDPRSLGVVTFSQPQQTLVEDLLDRARADDPELDAALARAGDEPLFVKNLENVQGDERDVILFSIGYGQDAQGRVLMNFGPLNKPGGERRLNVAITRAREQIVVLSTLTPEQIDLSRVGATAAGPRHLRAFLEYAQHGPRALAAAAAPVPGGVHESPLEADVGGAIAALGYAVDPQVGCSGYRIDLGVKAKDAPGRYLLGVECDGASYHSAKTARDRDRLRQGVLEALGWRLHRVWSTDWLYDRAGEIRRLAQAIAAAEQAAAAPARSAAPAQPAPAPKPASGAGRAAARVDRAYAATPAGKALGDQDSFHEPAADAKLRARIEQIVAVEAPLSLDLLLARLAPSFGIKRLTPRVRERVVALLARCEVEVEVLDAERTWLWRRDQDPAGYSGFRGCGDRESSDIPPVEIANAAAEVLASGIGLTHDALVREVARVLGFVRAGKQIEEDMARGIAALVARGGARREGESVVVAT